MICTVLSQNFAYQKYHPVEAPEIVDFVGHLQNYLGVRAPLAFIRFKLAPQESL